jgi:hypothetical protein
LKIVSLSFPRKLVRIENSQFELDAVPIDVGSFHNRNAILLNIINLLSWSSGTSMYVGGTRIVMCAIQLFDFFPKSKPEASYLAVNFLRSFVELSPYSFPFLMITDLTVTIFRKMQYLKNWKFSFDQIADMRDLGEERVLVSVIL